jgi:hypothetical protein
MVKSRKCSGEHDIDPNLALVSGGALRLNRTVFSARSADGTLQA